MAARVAILTPFAAPSVRGNAITVDRSARGPRERGAELRVWDLSVAPETAVEHQIGQFRPAVVHAFHALRTGPAALRLAGRVDAPLLVTVTGTDVNLDLLDPDSAPVVRRVLEGASAISVFDESMATAIVEALPEAAGRLVVIPQSAAFEAAPPGHWAPAATLRRATGPPPLFPARVPGGGRPPLPPPPPRGLLPATSRLSRRSAPPRPS